jgi:hypothetical protein
LPSTTLAPAPPHTGSLPLPFFSFHHDPNLKFAPLINNCSLFLFTLFSRAYTHTHTRAHTDDDQDELDSDDEEFMYPMQNPNIDTSRIDEIPAKEPKFNAVPLKSALKKKTSHPGTPTQDSNKTLHERQANSSFK